MNKWKKERKRETEKQTVNPTEHKDGPQRGGGQGACWEMGQG